MSFAHGEDCEDRYDWCQHFKSKCNDPEHQITMERQCKETCGKCGDTAEEQYTYCSLLSPCQNGGTCLDDTLDWYKCVCPAPYTGDNCELVDDCLKDQPIMCHTWAAQGECCRNNDYMMKNCKQACGLCDTPAKQLDCTCADDENQQCQERAQKGECCTNPSMLKTCKESCSQCGGIKPVPGCSCMDNHPHCESWKDENQCTENPDYMNKFCKKSCEICKVKQIDENCKDHFDWCSLFEMECKITSSNYDMMKEFCKKTCNLCEAAYGPPADIIFEIKPKETFVEDEEPTEYRSHMQQVVGADPGSRQNGDGVTLLEAGEE